MQTRWILKVHNPDTCVLEKEFEADNRAGVIDLFYNWLRMEGELNEGGYQIQYFQTA